MLNRIDQYLLKNYPTVWRTRIHYIVIFSTLLGNVLAFVVPYLYPLTLTQLPEANDLDFIQTISLLFAGFAVLFWGFKLSQYKLKTTSLKGSMLTVLLYWLGCWSICLNLWVFNKTVQYKVGNLVDQVYLNMDKKLAEDYLVKKPPLKLNDVIAALNQYGIFEDDYSQKTEYEYGKSEMVHSELNYFYEVRLLKDRIGFIEECKLDGGWLNKDGFQIIFFFMIIGLLVLPMTGILFTLTSLIPVFGFMFCHFLYMVLMFNLGFHDRHLDEAWTILSGGVLLGIFCAFRRIQLKKLLQLFLMTIGPPLVFFYLINNVENYRRYVDIVPLPSLIGCSLLMALLTGILTYWYQRSSVKPY